VTLLKATDALGQFGALEFDQWTNIARTATAKLDAICNRSEVGWSSALRDFIGAHVDLAGSTEPYDVPLVSDAVSWGSNVLNYMRLIAQSDWLSFLFASADGNLTLRPVVGFESLIPVWSPGSPVAAFGGAGIPFQAISAQYGSETLFSEVSIDTDAIDAQTSSVADPAAWRLAYGPSRRLSLPSLLLGASAAAGTTAEDAALLMADDLLAYYDTPTYRITELSVELAALDSTDQDTVLAIEIANPVTVSFTPNGVGSDDPRIACVQGIAHQITPESHVVTFALIDFAQ